MARSTVTPLPETRCTVKKYYLLPGVPAFSRSDAHLWLDPDRMPGLPGPLSTPIRLYRGPRDVFL